MFPRDAEDPRWVPEHLVRFYGSRPNGELLFFHYGSGPDGEFPPPPYEENATRQHPVQNLTAFVMVCVPSPYAILTGPVYVFQKKGFYDIRCDNCNLTNCITTGESNRGFLLVHQPPFVMLPVNATGPWYSNSCLQVIHELPLLLQRPK